MNNKNTTGNNAKKFLKKANWGVEYWLPKNLIIQPIDDYGFDGDYIESEAFAYLAIRSFLNLPISFPGTTKCKSPTTGGVLIENF